MTQDPSPHEALASIKAAREEIGRDLDYPFWWDITNGAVLGAMVASRALPAPWNNVVFIFCILGLVFMVQWWKKRFGWWVNGYSPRRAGKVAWVLVAFMMAMMVVVFWTNRDGPWWAPLAAGLATWIVAAISGRLWMGAYRKDLAELPR
jgi:hypothetical protein